MSDILQFGPYALHGAARLLEKDGRRVELGSRAFDLLHVLAGRAGEVVPKRELIDAVWRDVVVEENSLRVHIAALRKALEDGVGGTRYVVNVPGQGYSFVAPVQRDETPAELSPPAVPVAPSLPSLLPTLLPARLARMIGRDEALDELRTQLVATRFVTVTGPGGMGKTTVALALAHALRASFDGAVCFVDLAALAVPDLLASTVAATLGCPAATLDASTALERFIGARRLLLLLDSCEHLVDAATTLAERLVGACPQLHLLVTSREALRAEGEQVCRLPPLACPEAGAAVTAADAARYPAVQLFVERAAASGSPFALTDDDAGTVAMICRRLDGIALAIELGAGRVGTYGLQGTVTLLDNRFRLFWQGRRTALPRHQTLNGMLDWSYQLLPPDERMVLRKLSVFVGHFSLEAAAEVVASDTLERWQVTAAIDSLVAKSLAATDTVDGMRRYRLLDSARMFAATRLTEHGEQEALARRHAQVMVAKLAVAQTHGEAGDPTLQRARDTALLANTRAALAWSFALPGGPGAPSSLLPGGAAVPSSGDAALGANVAAAASGLMMRLSLLDECQRWCRTALAAGVPLAPDDELTLQEALAISTMFTRGNDATVRTAIERGLSLAEELGEATRALHLLTGLNIYLTRVGRFHAALAVAHRAHGKAQQLGTPAALAMAQWSLGVSCNLVGDHAGAQAHCERGFQIAAGQSFPTILFGYCHRIRALIALARTLWVSGDSARAMALARDTIAVTDTITHPVTVCISLIYNATVFLWQHELACAAALIDRLLDQARAHRLAPYVAVGTGLLGKLRCLQGAGDEGIGLLRSCLQTLREEQHYILCAPFARALAEALVERGAVDEAAIHIDEALAGPGGEEEAFDTAELLRVKGLVLLRAGQREAALPWLERALDCARRQGALAFELRVLLLMADEGIVPAAEAELAELVGRFPAGADTAELRVARNRLAGGQGRHRTHVIGDDDQV